MQGSLVNGNDAQRLGMMLKGTPEGLTREQVAARLNVSDRAARQAIEDVVATGELPIICDRGDSGREEGRYRIAGPGEVQAVNQEIREHRNRAMSALRRAKGLHTAFLAQNHGAALFLDSPEVDA